MLSTALVALAAILAIYAVVVLALVMIGRQQHARELIRFAPDCAVLFGRLARDPVSRRSIRVAALATAAYVSFPIDFVPDFIPVAGQIDDIVVIALVLRFVVKRAGEDAIRRHWPGSEGGLRAVLRLAAPAR